MLTRLAAAAAAALTLAAASAAPAAAAPAADIPAPAGSRVAVATGAPGGLIFGNVTVTAPRGGGHLSAWPCNQTRPATSVANYTAGVTRATGVAVRADSNGDICFYTSTATHIVYDRTGVSASGTGNLAAPARLADTRTGANPGAGATLAVHTGAPAGSVAVLTLTAVPGTSGGWVAAHTCGQPRPASSHLTFAAGTPTANTAAVKADANGDVCLYTSAPTHLVVDQVGATRLLTAFPGRALDTRATGALPAGGVATIPTGNPGAVLLGNVTALAPAGPGWLAAYPCAEGRAGTSTVNFAAGATTSNFAAVKTDAAGNVCIYTTAPTHVLFDLEAVSQTTITSASPVRSLDTRALDVPLHPGTGKAFPATVARWAPTVLGQLAARGLPATYTPGVLAQITQESSGVPDAVNDWDSNWSAGIASFGLLQTIYPTFNAYASPACKGPNTPKLVKGVWQQYTPTMVDPGCNIGAGLSYVKGRYGLGKFDLWNTGNNPAY